MTAVSAVNPKLYFPQCPAGTVDVYIAGTTSRTNTWQDRDQTTLNTNPINLNSRGECVAWLDSAIRYKFVVKNAGGVTVYTVDDVAGAQPGAASVAQFTTDTFSGTGAQTVFTLSVTPSHENATNVFVGGVYQKKGTYSLSGANLTFSVAPASGTDNIEVVTTSILDYTDVAADIADSVATAAASAATAESIATSFGDLSSAVSAASASATLAQDWATKTSGEVVVGQGYGAKKYAQDAASAVADVADYVTTAQAAAAQSVANAPGAVVNALIGTETSAIAISAEDTAAYAMKVVDASNPANNRTGRVLDILSSLFSGPKLTIQSDGRSLRWSAHNFYTNSNTPASLASGASTATGQTDSDGGLTAVKFTATSGTYAGTYGSPGLFTTGRYYMQEYIVRAGTATLCYVHFNDGSYRHAYFNLSTGAVGTVDAGVTASISTSRADGTVLPSGFYRVTAAYVNTVGIINMGIGMCDADGSKNVTVGRTFYMEKPMVHFGLSAQDYIENPTSSITMRAPYDYSKGGARILIEPSSTYNSRYGNDLTNAAWTKTNCTAAYTATGPDNSPCSSLTASAVDATCLQSIADATASQVFSAFVRRKTGTGSVYMTADNGGTWTNITSLINSTYYVRLQVAGGANPTIGFKIATNTDAIEVSYAINTNSSFISSPVPITSASVTRSADTFIVPTTLLTSATNYSVFVDYDRLTGSASPDDSIVRIGRTDFTKEMRLSVVSGAASMTANDGTTNKNYPIWTYSSGERIELSSKIEDSKHVMSINGEPPAWITTVGAITVQQARLGTNAPMFLRRLLIVPRAVDKDDLRTWRYSGTTRNSTLAAAAVAYDSDTDYANATMNRQPTLCVLSDDGATADVLVFWGQKHDTGHHVEAPERLMQRKYRFSKTAGTLTALTTPQVCQQQAGWVSGLGMLQSPNAFVIPTGANAGRIILLFTQLDSAAGTFVPDLRNIYVTHNDAGGDATQWTTPVKIVDVGTSGYAIVDCGGSGVILPPDHSVAPNRIVTNYYTATGVKSLYSDDWGVTWTSGTNFFPATQPDESTISLLPDGTLVLMSRVEVASLSRRNWAKSTDGGVSWVDQGVLPSYSYAQCSTGADQLDTTGATGPYGKTAISHPVNSSSRLGVQIDIATDAAMTFGSPIKPWAVNRYFGYSSIKGLFGGSHIALAVEGGSVPFNTDNTIYLGFVEAA